LYAAPTALVVADTVAATSPTASRPSVEDHFLSNRLAWAVAGVGPSNAVYRNGLMYVSPLSGLPWAEARPRRLKATKPGVGFTAELLFTEHSAKGTAVNVAPMGGLLFAHPSPGASGASLAAVVGSDGRAAIIALDHGHVRPLVGPRGNLPVRISPGPNLLRISVKPTSDATWHVLVALNGGVVLGYSTPPGWKLAPATSIVSVGPEVVVSNSLRLWGGGWRVGA